MGAALCLSAAAVGVQFKLGTGTLVTVQFKFGTGTLVTVQFKLGTGTLVTVQFKLAATTGQPRWLPLSALAATGRAGCHWPRWLPLAGRAGCHWLWQADRLGKCVQLLQPLADNLLALSLGIHPETAPSGQVQSEPPDRGNKRITLKMDDMRVDRIARIFQVSMDSLYITDATNVAIFLIESGCFSSLDLFDHVRFTEAEATVSAILVKLKVAMGDEEDYILTDTLSNEIVESEGTTGSLYWRQNSRKIHAIESTAYRQWRRRRSSTGDRNDHVQRLRDNVEELLEASQGLDEVAKKITDLVTVSRGSSLVWPEFKQAFVCLICRATMTQPMFSSCCRTLVGCTFCVEEWKRTSDHCLKCRDDLPIYTEVAGLSAALDALKSLP
ncbi:unnamed protein product [Gadus morhua 'NCC']